MSTAGPCPPSGNHIQPFKCEVIQKQLGKLGTCLTPDTHLLSPYCKSNRPDDQPAQRLEGLHLDHLLTPFRIKEGEERRIDRVIAWNGKPRGADKDLILQDGGHVGAVGIRADLVLMTISPPRAPPFHS